MENKVVTLDEYRALEDIVKNRLGAEQVVIAAVLKSGEFSTFIPDELIDIDLVYIIQTLKDRRSMRVSE